MNRVLLQPHIQEFIKSFKGDITKLAFSGSPFPEVTIQALIQQIQGRAKAKNKLAYLLDTDGIYYPPKLNLEQTSSEQAANYKAALILPGTLADLTGGLGIDAFHFSKKASAVTYFELNESLCAIAQHNFTCLDAQNISVENNSGLSILDATKKFNTIFIDPSRRAESQQKVFFLHDCEPNVPDHCAKILIKCDLLIIKTSPMLDIQIGLDELKGVYEIHVVAVNNEVKELLWLCKEGIQSSVLIKTVNLKQKTRETFVFKLNTVSKAQYSNPLQYLYEPNTAILKSGGFTHISAQLNLLKIQQHSHLFTSNTLQEFPGRAFHIESVIPYSKKEMKANIAGLKANVTTRNFSETVAALRKKWKLKDGGDVYLFFTTLLDNSRVVIKCSKVLS